VILEPAKNPCGSCPYRCDAPSGLWSESEYGKLPPFDRPLAEQPARVFMCHQADGRLCAGWVATHDMSQSLGLRIAFLNDHMTTETFEAVLKYKTNVPVFTSGQEAYDHGMRDIDDPTIKTRIKAAKLIAKRPDVDFEHRRQV